MFRSLIAASLFALVATLILDTASPGAATACEPWTPSKALFVGCPNGKKMNAGGDCV